MKNNKIFYLFIILLASCWNIPNITLAENILELAYDDGSDDSNINTISGRYIAVKFSLPEKCSKATIKNASFFIQFVPASFNLHIFDSDGLMELMTPRVYMPDSTGWFIVPLNVTVTDDFYLALDYLQNNTLILGLDTSSSTGHSFGKLSISESWIKFDFGNVMFRVTISELETVLEQVPELEETTEQKGIPGFPYTAIALGLVIVLLLRDRIRY